MNTSDADVRKTTCFPNLAGKPDIDDALAAELEAAGIEVGRYSFLKDGKREVDTSVRGGLHGWSFERAWYYWRCSGPGIEVAAAERLHAEHGKDVRVAGHCGCPSPTEWCNGLAVGDYHVDTPVGLKALADTIRALVERAMQPGLAAPPTTDALRGALKIAISHIEHMSAWIALRNAGYSFEGLGEDMPSIRAALDGAPGAPAIPRPDWAAVYAGCVHGPDRDQELIAVTRETLRLAASAIRERNARDYYHNSGAALGEIEAALSPKEKENAVPALHDRSVVPDPVRLGPDDRTRERPGDTGAGDAAGGGLAAVRNDGHPGGRAGADGLSEAPKGELIDFRAVRTGIINVFVEETSPHEAMMAEADGADRVLTITYTNYRGETSVRRIIPKSVRFGSTEWHPEPQWLLLAWDDDKRADREFALKDFGAQVEEARKTALTNAMTAVEELRINGAANFTDPRYAGQRGADHADALYDAYHAIRLIRDGSDVRVDGGNVRFVNAMDGAEIAALIDKLRASEGDSVTILCDNPDFNGQPDRVIVANGEWTDWQDRRFGGDTLVQALRAAVRELEKTRSGA